MSSTSAVAVLAQGLRELRDFAEGPDGEQLQQTTGLTAQQIHAALAGEQLPTREVTLALVEAWEGDVEAWHEYWGQISELAQEDQAGKRKKKATAQTPTPPEPSIITPIAGGEGDARPGAEDGEPEGAGHAENADDGEAAEAAEGDDGAEPEAGVDEAAAEQVARAMSAARAQLGANAQAAKAQSEAKAEARAEAEAKAESAAEAREGREGREGPAEAAEAVEAVGAVENVEQSAGAAQLALEEGEQDAANAEAAPEAEAKNAARAEGEPVAAKAAGAREAKAPAEASIPAQRTAKSSQDSAAKTQPSAVLEGVVVAGGTPKPKNRMLARLGIPILVFAIGVAVGAFGDHALNSKQSSTNSSASVPPASESSATSSKPSHSATSSPSSPSGTPSSVGDSASGSASSTDTAGASGTDSTASSTSTIAPGTALGAYVGIQLASGYSVSFLNDPYHPAAGTSNGPDTMGFFASSFVDGRFYADRLAILDSTDTGSYTSCLNDTRYQHDVLLSQVAAGGSFCITTGTGHVVLVTVRRMPSSTDANPYAVLDVTVWQEN